ncbi:nitrate- and nitrite sensing domain-containing protein [Kitasatospora sp. NPDC003701]
MRLRSSSIRAKIIALLLVPIVALTALWVYATLATTGDVWSQLAVSSTYKEFGKPVDQYAYDLQNERRAAVQRLADPTSAAARDAFERAQAVTDRDLAVLREKKTGDGGKLDAAQRGRYLQILAAADQLAPLRGQISRSALNWEFALGQYGDLVKPTFGFRSAFVARQSGQLPRQGTILIELARAREYLSQEDAAMEGLRTAPGRPTSEQYQVALDALHNQQALFTVYIAELDPVDQIDYIALRGGEAWAALARAEADFVGAGGPERVVQAINGDSWRETADRALGDLAAINTRLAGAIGDRERSYAIGLLWRGGIAGAIGLVAVVLSVMISYRIGRGLARELIGLRNAANELAGTRLPSVMLRLRRGEAVDVATEAPELQFGPAEIGQVGRAINAVQRAAVEAAVEQADLRRGVSAVFVNLARRSQVLLHRQLTLLDTMERRTEDPAELEDLFKVDHLTTRMRRHAEGLIILAGGSPGRAWRKPVRMVDVVRAAVGEVEDYARVIVRPFPGTGLLGSAVADVTHLVAELVENAAVYSPPSTQVTVQGEVVAHGFALEIDDRGLGLSEQALAEINERLAVEQEFDLADTDRLGLFVVSRLARRHGIRVHLRPSPYGGTTAVVLIPRELLADVSDGPAAAAGTAPGRRAVPARHGERDLVVVPAPGGAGGRGGAGASGAADGAAGPETRRAAGAASDQGGRHRGSGGPRPSAPETARTPGGLPRRARNRSGPTLVTASPDEAVRGPGRHRREGLTAPEGAAETGPQDVGVLRRDAEAAGLAGRAPVERPQRAVPWSTEQSPHEQPSPEQPSPEQPLTGQPSPGQSSPEPRSADRRPDGPGPLPRRVRQASLAPQLRERAVQEPERPAAESPRERSPEEARAAFASFQRGFTRGRGPAAAAPVPPARPAAAPGWQPPDPTRRAISPAPAPAALPAPPPGDRAPLARRVPGGPLAPRPARTSPSSPAVPAPPAPPAPAEGRDS